MAWRAKSGPVWSGLVRFNSQNLLGRSCLLPCSSFNHPSTSVMQQPKHLALYDSLLEAMEIERASFTDEKAAILSYQAAALRTVLELLQEDTASLERRSKQRRSERKRARAFLVDTYTGVSPEVFMLCIISTAISKMENLVPRLALPRLKTWLMGTSVPKGLTALTMEVCHVHSIGTLISSHQTLISTNYDPLLCTEYSLSRLPVVHVGSRTVSAASCAGLCTLCP